MQTQTNTHNLSRLKIDNIKPKWITCIWLFFFVVMIVLLLLVLAVPDSIQRYRYGLFAYCPDDHHLSDYCKPFNANETDTTNFNPNYSIFVTRMTNKHQFFLIDIQPIQKPNSSAGTHHFEMDLEFTLHVYSLDKKFRIEEELYDGFQHKIEIECHGAHQGADEEACELRTVLYVNQINHENYLIVLEITNTDELVDKIHRFDSYITTVDPGYTSFLLSLRYIGLIISIIFAVYYWRSLKQMRGEKLVFEQKYIRVLGILLILFNDPIYASTVLRPTLASAVFSSMFVITFICALLLFWIAAFQRVYRENTQVKTKALSWPKLVYIFFLWLFSVVAYCILSRQYLKDPSFDFNDEYHHGFKAFKVIMIILVGIGFAWILYGFTQILRKYNSLIWRHKIFFSFSCYFIFCYFVCKIDIKQFLLMRFIVMFTGSISVYNLNGTKVMLVFCLTNIYVWFLQILYGPSDQGFQGSDQPIALSEDIMKFQGYEVLDENSLNRDSGVHEEGDHEERNPDQIMLQLDGDGNVYGKNMGNKGFGFSNDNTNFDNFGNSGNLPQQRSTENINAFPQFNLEMANRDKHDSSGEQKYPYEVNDDNGESG